MADVKIAVRLRRKTRHHLGVAPGGYIGIDDVADKVAARPRRCGLVHHRIPRLYRSAYVANSRARAKAKGMTQISLTRPSDLTASAMASNAATVLSISRVDIG